METKKASLLPMQLFEIVTPENFKALTLRVTNIAPGGFIYGFTLPAVTGAVRFDAEHSLHRIERSGERIYLKCDDGAKSCKVEIVEVEEQAPIADDAAWDNAEWDKVAWAA